MELAVLLGVGVGMAEPPVKAMYQSKLAPGATPPAVSGDKALFSQNV